MAGSEEKRTVFVRVSLGEKAARRPITKNITMRTLDVKPDRNRTYRWGIRLCSEGCTRCHRTTFSTHPPRALTKRLQPPHQPTGRTGSRCVWVEWLNSGCTPAAKVVRRRRYRNTRRRLRNRRLPRAKRKVIVLAGRRVTLVDCR